MGQNSCQLLGNTLPDELTRKSFQSNIQYPLKHTSQNSLPKFNNESLTQKATNFNNFIQFTAIDNPKLTFHLNLYCKQTCYKNKNNDFNLKVTKRDTKVFLSDEGVGLGIFIYLKKWQQAADNSQLLIDCNGKFIVLHFKKNYDISYSLYQHELSSEIILLKSKQIMQINIGNEQIMLINKQINKNSNNYYALELQSKQYFGVYMQKNTQVFHTDIVKLGADKFIINLETNDNL